MVERKVYDRKIIRVGGSRPARYINVTRILPPDWEYIRIHKPKIEENKATIVIECLYKITEPKKEG